MDFLIEGSNLSSRLTTGLSAGGRQPTGHRVALYGPNGPAERCCGPQSAAPESTFFQLGDFFCVPSSRERALDYGYFSGGRRSLFNQPLALIPVSGSATV
jgi:hypothetical protein